MSDSTLDHQTDARSPDSQERLARAAAPDAVPHASGAAQRIGRFELRRLLGEGAYGCVHLAFDTLLRREVALKVPLHVGFNPASRERFLREARATATVIHPNVCQVHEVETEGNVPYIVMRYVEGGNLVDLLRRAGGPLPPQTAVTIVRKLALGLAAAHTKGIVHRDLKPSNVLYDEANDDVLLTDFGLAKFLEHASLSSGGIKGTPAYMPPEQFGDGQTPGDVGALADVYSLGVILYELVTGKLPFQGNPLAQMLAHLQQIPQLPSARIAGLDIRLDSLCMKALAKAPTDRHASAKAFADALGAYLRSAESPVPPPQPTEDELRAQAEADYKLGADCHFGRGVPVDYAKAREFYEKAVAQGHAGAQNNLGYLYRNALGVPQDYAKARELYEKAAARGYASAQNNLGYLYEHALGVPQDYAKACEFYEKAVAQGNAHAQNNLGLLYQHALGVPQDYAKAHELYEKALAQGHATAQNNLGYLYLHALGVPQDYAKARELFKKAIAQDVVRSNYHLGTMYEAGLGVARDETKARELYEKAAAQDDEDAKNALARLNAEK